MENVYIFKIAFSETISLFKVSFLIQGRCLYLKNTLFVTQNMFVFNGKCKNET